MTSTVMMALEMMGSILARYVVDIHSRQKNSKLQRVNPAFVFMVFDILMLDLWYIKIYYKITNFIKYTIDILVLMVYNIDRQRGIKNVQHRSNQN